MKSGDEIKLGYRRKADLLPLKSSDELIFANRQSNSRWVQPSRVTAVQSNWAVSGQGE